MYWATTTFRVIPSPELPAALKAWAAHIEVAHPKITEVRCYRLNGGTEIVCRRASPTSTITRTSSKKKTTSARA